VKIFASVLCILLIAVLLFGCSSSNPDTATPKNTEQKDDGTEEGITLLILVVFLLTATFLST